MAQSTASPFDEEVQVSGQIGDDRTTWSNMICKSSRPSVAFFTLFFRFVAILLYWTSSWFSLDYVTTFVVSVLLLACDFWVIKNISGRLLVGLRWGTTMKEDGSTEWFFHSHPERAGNAHAVDSRVFWLSVFAAPVLWLVACLHAVLTLQLDWLILCCFALVLTGTNTYGYYKCSAAARARIQSTLADTALRAAVGGTGAGGVGSALFASMFGGAAAAASAAATPAVPATAVAVRAPAAGTSAQAESAAFVGDASGLDSGAFVESAEASKGPKNPFGDDDTV